MVLDEGSILQTGPTPEVYRRPGTTKVAEVFSDPPINFITGVVAEKNIKLGEDIELPFVEHMKSLGGGGTYIRRPLQSSFFNQKK